jgi:hypothetical protein
MSAFIVTSDTMHRCVKAFEHVRDKIAAIPDVSPSELGQLLFKLNHDAVSFGDMEGFEEIPDPYVYVEPEVTLAGMFKSIACLTYQCCEGDITERPLYKVAQRVEERLIYELTLDPVASEERTNRAFQLSRDEPWD